MSETESYRGIGWAVKPVPMVCPCNVPLTLSKLPDGRWVLGHLDAMCSPIIHGKSLEKVMGAFVERSEEQSKSKGQENEGSKAMSKVKFVVKGDQEEERLIEVNLYPHATRGVVLSIGRNDVLIITPGEGITRVQFCEGSIIGMPVDCRGRVVLVEND